MKYIITSLMAVVSCLSFSPVDNGKNQINPKPKVAILGVFHFAGSSADIAAIQLEDPLGERRQREIKEVVDKLRKYKPTKVLIEYPKVNDDRLNEELEKYLSDNGTLGVSERYQIGFRLVKQLNQKKVYPIDHKMNLPIQKIAEYCQKTEKMNEFNTFIQGVKSMMQDETHKLKDMTIGEYLEYINTAEFDIKANEVYLNDMLDFGDSESEAGLEVSATWWKRNMYIFKNIVETIDAADERILVIIGSSHRAVIKDFVEDRSDLDYVEIAEYLK